MEVVDVVRKLIGPIEPVADSSVDSRRFENLEAMCLLVDKLLFDIHCVAKGWESPMASVNKAGQYARKYINDVKEADL